MSSEYVYPDYEQSNTIKDWHNVPRFGQPDSFTELESENDVWQYVYGTLLVPGCFFAIFILFCCTSCKFTCCPGLCAREQETEEKTAARCSAGFKRVAFICTSLLSTLACALYALFMMPDILDAIEKTEDNSAVAYDILNGTRVILEGLRVDGFYTRQSRDFLVEDLDEFCPENAAAEEAYGVNFDELTAAYTESLKDLEEFLYPDIPDIYENITTRAMNVTFMVDDRMDTANLTFNGVYYLLLGLAGLYFLLSSSTVILGLGCMEKRRRGCAKGFVYPVLLVTSFLSIALAGGVGMGLIIGSDFCSGGGGEGSPTETMIASILQHDPTIPGTYYFEGVLYVLREKCMGPSPLPFPEYSTELRAAIESSNVFISEVESIGQDALGATCGSSVLEETLALSKGVKQNMTNLVKLSDALSGPNGALTCETFMPIYDEVINETACSDSIGYGIYGFILVSAVSIFSLIMIACRPLPELVISEKYDDDEVVKEIDVEENADDKDMPSSGDDETNSNTNSAQEAASIRGSKSNFTENLETGPRDENADGNRDDDSDGTDAILGPEAAENAVDTSTTDFPEDVAVDAGSNVMIEKSTTLSSDDLSEDEPADVGSDDNEEKMEKPLDAQQ